MPLREKSTCTRMSQSTCGVTQSENRGCCFTRQTAHHIYTANWRTAGLHRVSSRWGWTRKVWAGTPSNASARPGCVVRVAWKTSTMAHKPKTMSEIYSHLHEELPLRLDEAERVGYGFTIPKSFAVVPNVPRFSDPVSVEVAA